MPMPGGNPVREELSSPTIVSTPGAVLSSLIVVMTVNWREVSKVLPSPNGLWEMPHDTNTAGGDVLFRAPAETPYQCPCSEAPPDTPTECKEVSNLGDPRV
ncbi:hypothetical protein N7449_000456 [Penicillium cf. viridicatum]|uniref:Uncharacterized protein n=1 Tax=Penicillium cf. viridicatum TaxID=2972119 RepID=A0A9W9T8B4_9EURO|nr:hypothetical protein N7449_000456 [Penicillium cf. viridicatum]